MIVHPLRCFSFAMVASWLVVECCAHRQQLRLRLGDSRSDSNIEMTAFSKLDSRFRRLRSGGAGHPPYDRSLQFNSSDLEDTFLDKAWVVIKKGREFQILSTLATQRIQPLQDVLTVFDDAHFDFTLGKHWLTVIHTVLSVLSSAPYVGVAAAALKTVLVNPAKTIWNLIKTSILDPIHTILSPVNKVFGKVYDVLDKLEGSIEKIEYVLTATSTLTDNEAGNTTNGIYGIMNSGMCILDSFVELLGSVEPVEAIISALDVVGEALRSGTTALQDVLDFLDVNPDFEDMILKTVVVKLNTFLSPFNVFSSIHQDMNAFFKKYKINGLGYFIAGPASELVDEMLACTDPDEGVFNDQCFMSDCLKWAPEPGDFAGCLGKFKFRSVKNLKNFWDSCGSQAKKIPKENIKYGQKLAKELVENIDEVKDYVVNIAENQEKFKEIIASPKFENIGDFALDTAIDVLNAKDFVGQITGGIFNEMFNKGKDGLCMKQCGSGFDGRRAECIPDIDKCVKPFKKMVKDYTNKDWLKLMKKCSKSVLSAGMMAVKEASCVAKVGKTITDFVEKGKFNNKCFEPCMPDPAHPPTMVVFFLGYCVQIYNTVLDDNLPKRFKEDPLLAQMEELENLSPIFNYMTPNIKLGDVKILKNFEAITNFFENKLKPVIKPLRYIEEQLDLEKNGLVDLPVDTLKKKLQFLFDFLETVQSNSGIANRVENLLEKIEAPVNSLNSEIPNALSLLDLESPVDEIWKRLNAKLADVGIKNIPDMTSLLNSPDPWMEDIADFAPILGVEGNIVDSLSVEKIMSVLNTTFEALSPAFYERLGKISELAMNAPCAQYLQIPCVSAIKSFFSDQPTDNSTCSPLDFCARPDFNAGVLRGELEKMAALIEPALVLLEGFWDTIPDTDAGGRRLGDGKDYFLGPIPFLPIPVTWKGTSVNRRLQRSKGKYWWPMGGSWWGQFKGFLDKDGTAHVNTWEFMPELPWQLLTLGFGKQNGKPFVSLGAQFHFRLTITYSGDSVKKSLLSKLSGLVQQYVRLQADLREAKICTEDACSDRKLSQSVSHDPDIHGKCTFFCDDKKTYLNLDVRPHIFTSRAADDDDKKTYLNREALPGIFTSLDPTKRESLLELFRDHPDEKDPFYEKVDLKYVLGQFLKQHSILMERYWSILETTLHPDGKILTGEPAQNVRLEYLNAKSVIMKLFLEFGLPLDWIFRAFDQTASPFTSRAHEGTIPYIGIGMSDYAMGRLGFKINLNLKHDDEPGKIVSARIRIPERIGSTYKHGYCGTGVIGLDSLEHFACDRRVDSYIDMGAYQLWATNIEPVSSGEGSRPGGANNVEISANSTVPTGWIEDDTETNQIQGWACNPEDPSLPVLVRIYFGGEADGDSFWVDLEVNSASETLDSCRRTASHEFKLDVTAEMRNALDDGNGWVYGYAARNFAWEEGKKGLLRTPFELVNQEPIGHLDAAGENSKVRGWACDRDTPDLSIFVELFFGAPKNDGMRSPVTIRADVTSEAGVNGACKGGTNHRFAFDLTDEHFDNMNMGDGLVHAYGVDSYGQHRKSVALQGSPRREYTVKNVMVSSSVAEHPSHNLLDAAMQTVWKSTTQESPFVQEFVVFEFGAGVVSPRINFVAFVPSSASDIATIVGWPKQLEIFCRESAGAWNSVLLQEDWPTSSTNKHVILLPVTCHTDGVKLVSTFLSQSKDPSFYSFELGKIMAGYDGTVEFSISSK